MRQNSGLLSGGSSPLAASSRGARGLVAVVVFISLFVIRPYSAFGADAMEQARAATRVRDYKKTAVILKPLAGKGNAEAMYMLAGLYRSGRGVTKDESRAYGWTLRAARKGLVKAQFNLAIMYDMGVGVKASEDKALYWFRAAAQNGYAPAKERLAVARAKARPMPRIRYSGRRDPAREERLRWAVEKGEADKVRSLLSSGVRVDGRDRYGRTPLMIAAGVKKSSPEVVKLLLKSRAKVEAVDKYGDNALMIAARSGHGGMIRQLLSVGARTETRDRNGNTPLMLASKKGRLGAVQALVEGRARINASNKKGRNALMLAKGENNKKNQRQVVDFLISRGAKVVKARKSRPRANLVLLEKSSREASAKKGSPYEGWTPLMIAAWRGQSKVAGSLLGGGVDINKRGPAGYTALARAAWQGHEDIVAMLLARGARQEHGVVRVKTALMLSAENGRIKIMKRLLKAGGSVSARFGKKGQGESALTYAISAEREEAALLLISAGADIDITLKNKMTPLTLSARKGLNKTISALAGRGARLNKKDEQGHTALWYAVQAEKSEAVKELLSSGADVSLRYSETRSVLILAARGGNVKIIRTLIEAGAKTDVVTKSGNTPLMLAASTGAATAVRLFIKNKVPVDARNENGDTALILAASAGHAETVKALLEGGASQGIRNKRRERAATVAEGNAEVTKVLESYKTKKGWLGGLF